MKRSRDQCDFLGLAGDLQEKCRCINTS
jgi:hypothetical protein